MFKRLDAISGRLTQFHGSDPARGSTLTPSIRRAYEEPCPPIKIPITTSSEEARQLNLKGRDLVEKLRPTDARPFSKKN